MLIEDLINPQINHFNFSRYVTFDDPSFIPIKLTGGIGDVICNIDTISYLQDRFEIAVHTKHLEAFKFFYKREVPSFEVMPPYSWHLEMDNYCKFITKENFHGFLIKDHENLFLQQQAMFKLNPKINFITNDEKRRYFLISSLAKDLDRDKRSFPLLTLGYEDILEFKLSPKVESQKYITIHDGIDSSQNISGRATKQWKWSHWNTLIKHIKLTYPEYKIIQLGSKSSREIDGIDESLIGETTLTEAFHLLSMSKLHIDGDSGLVHAASRMQVPCVVLWGPTPIEYYGYPQNINLKSSVCSKACYGLQPNWNDKCVLGFSSPKCMDEILPEQVMKAVEYEL